MIPGFALHKPDFFISSMSPISMASVLKKVTSSVDPLTVADSCCHLHSSIKNDQVGELSDCDSFSAHDDGTKQQLLWALKNGVTVQFPILPFATGVPIARLSTESGLSGFSPHLPINWQVRIPRGFSKMVGFSFTTTTSAQPEYTAEHCRMQLWAHAPPLVYVWKAGNC